MTRSVEIAKAMAVAGFDWLFLDMEHGVMSLEACAQISTAALDAGIAPIARVPNGEYAIATRALDNGALGIVMPHVDSAAEAREVVNRLKYPPVGHRSMGGIGPHYELRSASSAEAAAALNAANLTIVMLETPTAIANAEEIAAVPGVDVLLIGTNDLCAEMGIHGDFGNERVANAYRTMIAAARNHSKFPEWPAFTMRRSCRATSRWALVLSWAARTPPSWPPAQSSAPGSYANSRRARNKARLCGSFHYFSRYLGVCTGNHSERNIGAPTRCTSFCLDETANSSGHSQVSGRRSGFTAGCRRRRG